MGRNVSTSPHSSAFGRLPSQMRARNTSWQYMLFSTSDWVLRDLTSQQLMRIRKTTSQVNFQHYSAQNKHARLYPPSGEPLTKKARFEHVQNQDCKHVGIRKTMPRTSQHIDFCSKQVISIVAWVAAHGSHTAHCPGAGNQEAPNPHSTNTLARPGRFWEHRNL